MRDLPQQTPPFDDDAVNVAHAKQISDPRLLRERIFMDGGNNLFRSRAIFWRNAIFEITRHGELPEGLMARKGKPSAPAIFLAAKTESRVEVRQIVNQFVQWIRFVFQSRGDG